MLYTYLPQNAAESACNYAFNSRFNGMHKRCGGITRSRIGNEHIYLDEVTMSAESPISDCFANTPYKCGLMYSTSHRPFHGNFVIAAPANRNLNPNIKTNINNKPFTKCGQIIPELREVLTARSVSQWSSDGFKIICSI